MSIITKIIDASYICHDLDKTQLKWNESIFENALVT